MKVRLKPDATYCTTPLRGVRLQPDRDMNYDD